MLRASSSIVNLNSGTFLLAGTAIARTACQLGLPEQLVDGPRSVEELARASGTQRRAGASGRGVFGAGVGAFAGLAFGVPGVILGPAVGALAFELRHRSGSQGRRQD